MIEYRKSSVSILKVAAKRDTSLNYTIYARGLTVGGYKTLRCVDCFQQLALHQQHLIGYRGRNFQIASVRQNRVQ
jgi:hypothetical protein